MSALGLGSSLEQGHETAARAASLGRIGLAPFSLAATLDPSSHAPSPAADERLKQVY